MRPRSVSNRRKRLKRQLAKVMDQPLEKKSIRVVDEKSGKTETRMIPTLRGRIEHKLKSLKDG